MTRLPVFVALLLAAGAASAPAADTAEHPACWGDTHVGDPYPAFQTADECLFCHRAQIAESWPGNPHYKSVETIDPDTEPYASVRNEFLAFGQMLRIDAVLGGRHVLRFLQAKSEPGSYSLLTSAFDPAGEGRLLDVETVGWDDSSYALRCGGCHSGAVDHRAKTFRAASVQCFSCHGAVPTAHSTDPGQAIFSTSVPTDPRVVVSACGQCHVRSGRSASTGLPYPNQFVAGDNLFRDLVFDLSSEALERENPNDRHVLENLREVAMFGRTDVTCVTCHSIHGGSTVAHRDLERTRSCDTCHETGSWAVRTWEVTSVLCEYGTDWEELKIERARIAEELRVAEVERLEEETQRMFRALRDAAIGLPPAPPDATPESLPSIRALPVTPGFDSELDPGPVADSGPLAQSPSP